MIGRALLVASRISPVQKLATTMPLSRNIVARFVAGEHPSDAVRVAGQLAGTGLNSSIDHLGEDTVSRDQADEVVAAYLDLLTALDTADLTDRAEVSVKLSAIGQSLPDGGAISLDNARIICAAAAKVGTTVTCDMEDHTTTDATLECVAQLRADFPTTGAVLQAYLHRTEGDCRDLARAGSRVRLCKGAYAEPESVAFQTRQEIDLAYVRCMRVLMHGAGYPMIATHDPRLIEIAGALAVRADRERGSFEYQMLYGVRPAEQRRLAAAGDRVRVYIPYGREWYGYMVRRMAEKPANLALAVRAIASNG